MSSLSNSLIQQTFEDLNKKFCEERFRAKVDLWSIGFFQW